ncbi:MAG: DUF547 domain-containing protein [Mariprofundaceae bacterium]|nr:DUF547 domain-containing protein [Mariprofundaceae bacterium]
MIRIFTFLFFFWLVNSAAMAGEFDHGDWNQLLRNHVVSLHDGQASVVDYSALADKHDSLKAYLARLSGVSRQQFDQWTEIEQLAFLINVYNAWTVELILTAWPEVASIRELGSLFRSPWQKEFIPLLGETRSLDDIEHGLIRGSGRYNDPRIHFAINCASIGCPALRAEAYDSERIDAQLEEQSIAFLTDRSRNRLENRVLMVSPIFKWYREDFERGWKGFDSLTDFFAAYATALGISSADVHIVQAGRMDVQFLDYDWRLNARQG